MRLEGRPNIKGSFLWLVGVVLCCLLTCFALRLPIASDVSQAPPSGAQQDGGDDAPLPYGGYLLAPAGQAQEPGEGPVNAYLLTMLVLVGVSAHVERSEEAGSGLLSGRRRSFVVSRPP